MGNPQHDLYIGAFLMGVGVLISLWNFVVSMRSGAYAGSNPWRADSLEWSIPSPPPDYAFLKIPTVTSRHPLWDNFDEYGSPVAEEILDLGRLTPSTSALDARPLALSQMPEDTIIPLLLALALTLVFTALVLKWMLVALAALLVAVLMSAVWLWPRSREEQLA